MDSKRAFVARTTKGIHSVLTTSECRPEAEKLRQELGRSFLPFLQAAARLPEELKFVTVWGLSLHGPLIHYMSQPVHIVLGDVFSLLTDMGHVFVCVLYCCSFRTLLFLLQGLRSHSPVV